jgi:hypothetical protein
MCLPGTYHQGVRRLCPNQEAVPPLGGTGPQLEPRFIVMSEGSVIPVPFDEENRGDPFRGDFPDPHGQEPLDELQTRLQRQTIELAQRRHEPATRTELLRALQRRRQPPQPDQGPRTRQQERQPQESASRPGDRAITQFDFLPVGVGFDTLLVRGELLVAAQSYHGRPGPADRQGADQNARPYLDALGMEASEVDCAELRGRVVRLTRRDMGPQELSDAAKALRAHGLAASVSHITPTAPISKAIGGPQAATSPGPWPATSCPGTPTKVAIVDTGISAERRTDGWLDDIPRGDNIDPLEEFPLGADDGYLDLDAGHGTFVAGIIQQIAPAADIRMYRAIDSDGIGSELAVACEMIRAVKDGAEILNLSLGCQTQDNMPPIAIRAALDVIRELEREHEREVLIVAAAGNYADTAPCWPGAFRQVISVAALAPDMQPSQWSSRGSWVSCSTIGQGLRSTYVQGRESVLVDPDPQDFGADSWAVWSGTSFTAPQITGALARLHEMYQYPLREALRRLLAAGRPIPEFGQSLRILPGI